jgi:serine/threonine-protein kinase SRPK3
VLREKYHFSVEDSKRIAGFLTPMLELLPVNRANAGGMSNHEFMNDTKGMDDVHLDVPVGSKGDGIEGWDCEVKKR